MSCLQRHSLAVNRFCIGGYDKTHDLSCRLFRDWHAECIRCFPTTPESHTPRSSPWILGKVAIYGEQDLYPRQSRFSRSKGPAGCSNEASGALVVFLPGSGFLCKKKRPAETIIAGGIFVSCAHEVWSRCWQVSANPYLAHRKQTSSL
jgi:hypothetical protein